MGRVYDLRAWHRIRQAHLLSEPLCRHCRESGITRPGKHVDHIQPVSKGGAWDDPANLQTLCIEHHSIKTLKDEGKNPRPYVQGCDTSGLPIDRSHHWHT